MSNMQFEQVAYAGDVQILKRRPFEGIAATLDFTDAATKNANGKKVVKAGTPIGAAGTADNTATVEYVFEANVCDFFFSIFPPIENISFFLC